jgi:hypothetical protein
MVLAVSENGENSADQIILSNKEALCYPLPGVLRMEIRY